MRQLLIIGLDPLEHDTPSLPPLIVKPTISVAFVSPEDAVITSLELSGASMMQLVFPFRERMLTHLLFRLISSTYVPSET